MQRRIWNTAALLMVGIATFSFGIGIALAQGASGNTYCGTYLDVNDCLSLDQFVQDNCCIDVNGTLRVATCTREEFYCWDGVDWAYTLGPGFNCSNIGGVCTP